MLDVRSDVPKTYEDSYDIAATQFSAALAEVKAINDALGQLEARLEQKGAPHTPGREVEWP